jgi:hypothetical protein
MSMNDVAKFVVISGWVGMLLACFGILFAVAYTAVTYPDTPISKELLGLAGTAFGFLFGNLPTMVKDLIKPTPSA